MNRFISGDEWGVKGLGRYIRNTHICGVWGRLNELRLYAERMDVTRIRFISGDGGSEKQGVGGG
jgi:hypothetical protein